MNETRNVLIIEDETAIRTAMVSALSMKGYRAIGAATAQEAEAFVRKEAVEIVLSDLRLENASGIQIIQKLKEIRPGIKPIVMTGYGSLESAIESLRLGAVDYLTKPFKIEELVEAMERASAAFGQPEKHFDHGFPFSRTFDAYGEAGSTVTLEIASLLRSTDIADADRSRTMSVISECVENARRHGYAGRKGLIHVDLMWNDGRLSGSVSDRGVGFEAGGVTAKALTGALPTRGLSFLQKTADDIKIQSEPGHGCTVHFVILAEPIEKEGTVCLPPVPGGNSWKEACGRITGEKKQVRIDFQRIEFLDPASGRELKEAVGKAREKGIRVSFENFRLPYPASELLSDRNRDKAAEGEDEQVWKQALWA